MGRPAKTPCRARRLSTTSACLIVFPAEETRLYQSSLDPSTTSAIIRSRLGLQSEDQANSRKRPCIAAPPPCTQKTKTSMGRPAKTPCRARQLPAEETRPYPSSIGPGRAANKQTPPRHDSSSLLRCRPPPFLRGRRRGDILPHPWPLLLLGQMLGEGRKARLHTVVRQGQLLKTLPRRPGRVLQRIPAKPFSVQALEIRRSRKE